MPRAHLQVVPVSVTRVETLLSGIVDYCHVEYCGMGARSMNLLQPPVSQSHSVVLSQRQLVHPSSSIVIHGCQ